MDLIKGEELLMLLCDGNLTLTSARVRFHQTESGKSRTISITLDSVVSCSLNTISTPRLLIYGVLAFGFAFILHSQASPDLFIFELLVFLAGIICIIAFFLGRSTLLTISSAGEKIIIPIRGSGKEPFLQFIDTLEHAKLFNAQRKL